MTALIEIPQALRKAPFTTAMARELGLSPTVLQGARFQRLWHDAYVHRDLPLTPTILAAAASLVLPASAIASHLTAAELLGAQVPWSPPPHFWLPQAHTGREITGINLHRFDIEPAAVGVDGLRVTTGYNTFVDLATVLDLVQLVAVGDSLVHAGAAAPEQLVRAAQEKGRRHIRKARAAASYVRPRVESTPESRTRMLLCLAGLPEPCVNVDALSARGTWLARPDLSYPRLRIAIEYDGRHHVEDPDQWDRDIRRVERLVREGWIVIVITHRQLAHHPLETILRVLDALHRRGHDRAPRFPASGWQPYFPTRAEIRVTGQRARGA